MIQGGREFFCVTSRPARATLARQHYGQKVVMADLIIIAYDTEATAEAARKKLLSCRRSISSSLAMLLWPSARPTGT